MTSNSKRRGGDKHIGAGEGVELVGLQEGFLKAGKYVQKTGRKRGEELCGESGEGAVGK